MASPSITTTFAGAGNQGLQVGYNSGSINIVATGKYPNRPETPVQPSCFVPFRRDPDFVDRSALLDQVHKQCSAPASRVALVGLGGVGKSQLAIEHCYRTAERSPTTWVFWVHASNTTRLEQSYREIAECVKIRGRNEPQADVLDLVYGWLRDEKNGPWLLVLDNADDASVLSATLSNKQRAHGGDGSNESDGTSGISNITRQHLSSYLPPQSKHGSVLVTSRTRRTAEQVVEFSDIIPIEPMDDTVAHALLRKKLGDQGDEVDGVAELAAAVDNMPLALVQAATYIRQRAPRCSVWQYLDEYRRSDSRKMSLLDQEAGHLRRDKAASNAILITWEISFDYIRTSRQSAANLLSLMSFFDRQGIPEALLHSANSSASNDNFEDDLNTLRDYSFVTVTRDTTVFEMHSLVQLATRKWLEGNRQLNRWKEQFVSILCAQLPTGEYKNWKTCQALYPHAKAALAYRPQSSTSLAEWALLLFNAAWYAWETCRADDAKQMSVVSREVRREVLGDENTDTISSMGMVGLAYSLKGKHQEAEVIYTQALETSKRVLGILHHVTRANQNNLARALDCQGKFEEAEALDKQTLTISAAFQGYYHPDTLKSMNNLGEVLYDQGKYEDAEAIHKQTLAVCEEILGQEDPFTITSMSNLALVLEAQGQYKQAEAMYRQVLAISEKVLGCDHRDTIGSVYFLACLLAKLQELDESLALFERACSAYEALFGKDHPATQVCSQRRDRTLKWRDYYHVARAPTKPDSPTLHEESQESVSLTSGSAHIGKMIRLTRGLARLKIGRSRT